LQITFLNLTPTEPSSTFSHSCARCWKKKNKTSIKKPPLKWVDLKLKPERNEMITNLNFLLQHNEKTKKYKSSHTCSNFKLKQKRCLKHWNHFQNITFLED
jgi:hypothetical protein